MRRKMGLIRISATLGLLLFLTNLAWWVECMDIKTDLQEQTQAFVKTLITPQSHIDPSSGLQAAYVLETHKAHIDENLYCALIARLYAANIEKVEFEEERGAPFSRGVVSVRAMCFRVIKQSKKSLQTAFKGFCLNLESESTQSQINVEFKKDTLILYMEENFREDDSDLQKLETFVFKELHNRYLLLDYSMKITGEHIAKSDVMINPIYRQKRDGKQIFMDKINNSVLEDLKGACADKKFCKFSDDD